MPTILATGTKEFITSESPCHPDAFYQISAQSDLLVWEEMGFEEFQDGHHGRLGTK